MGPRWYHQCLLVGEEVGNELVPPRCPPSGSSPAVSADPVLVGFCPLSLSRLIVTGNQLDGLSLPYPEVIIISFLSSFKQIRLSVVYLTVFFLLFFFF